MNRNKRVHIHIPAWVSTVYIVFSLVLVPWTLYLSLTLPAHHLSRHWDLSWVGLDIAILASLLTTGVLAFYRSRWMVISATAAGSFLLVDAWFDIISQRPGFELQEAIFLALVFEIPLAIMSYSLATKILIHNID